MKRLNINLYYHYILIITIPLFITLNNPLNIFSNTNSTNDSSVFIYIGNLIKHGYLPYIHAFDHKGPLVYFINTLGLLIYDLKGIWIIEYFFLITAFMYGYKFCSAFFCRSISILSTSFCFLLIPRLYEGGNITEIYSLSFICIGLYYFSKFYLSNFSLSNNSLVIIGLTLGCVLLLRVNNIGLWCAFCMLIFLIKIREGNYLSVAKYTFFFIIGSLIPILPFILWMYSNDMLTEFTYQYYSFNRKYVLYFNSRFLDIMRAFRTLSNNILFELSSLFFILHFFTLNNRRINLKSKELCFLLFFLISYASIIISAKPHLHYLIIVIPCFFYPVASILNWSLKIMKTYFVSYKSRVLILTLLILFFSREAIAKTIIVFIEKINHNREFEILIDVIKKNTTALDKITVLGNEAEFYTHSKRVSFSKFFYQTPLFEVSDQLMLEYLKDMERENPKLIVANKHLIFSARVKTSTNLTLFLDEITTRIKTNYTLLHDSNNYQIFILK